MFELYLGHMNNLHTLGSKNKISRQIGWRQLNLRSRNFLHSLPKWKIAIKKSKKASIRLKILQSEDFRLIITTFFKKVSFSHFWQFCGIFCGFIFLVTLFTGGGSKWPRCQNFGKNWRRGKKKILLYKNM